ncbi:MAG: NAD(P)-dependent oxidoreductase [Caldilineaceae bacterium]|nr:NAD(P)-dependent oxidoreductase [Caldilineaceae bacterium]
MNVLVSGALGRIGRYVVRELANAGHRVSSIDVNADPGIDLPGRYLRADLTDAGQVYQAVAWAEPAAAIHLGAWSNSEIVPETDTYGDNVRGSYNLFQACADMGVCRVISASSNQVYGFAGAPPVYLPVDEAHPLRPVNAYALAKIASEEAAEYFVRTRGMEILSFRFMGVRPPARIGAEIDAMQTDPATGARLLWTRTDARDAAAACRLAVEATDVEPGAYNIAGAQVVLQNSTAHLAARYFGDRTQIRAPLEGHTSPLSCAKARRGFGYEPRYVWRWNRRYD